ncbi:MAG TPA: HAD family hydrolase [Streptosporangiaceae bacterium]|nr:HAD family hydrolase [Streptosporangiaceae bacterium]
MTLSGVSCLALDFGGTIATPGRTPHGHDVTEVLRARFGYEAQPGLAETIEAVRNEAAEGYRRSGRQTPWEMILGTAAGRSAVELPDLSAVADALWESVPDGVVDPAAAAVIHRLHDAGRVLILACNTQRPLASRQRTLAAAGLAGCFAALVLSSVTGIGKPDPAFYAAVCRAARRVAGCGPDGVTLVGDTLAKDVTGPLRSGMRAVLIHAGPPPAGLPGEVPVIAHLADLPGLLERCHGS